MTCFKGITSKSNKTPNIELKKGVAQGSPISPVLFNLAIDDIIKNLTEHEIAQ